MERFPHLQNFFGAYLNQDYDYNGDSLDEIVLNYKQSMWEHDLEETRQEIAEFLAEYGRPGQDIVKAYRNTFSPEVTLEAWEGMNTRKFFEQMREWLARPIPGWEPFPNLRKFFRRGLNPHAGEGESLKDIVFNYKKTTHRHELDQTRQEIAAFLAEYGSPGQDLDKAFRDMFSPEVPWADFQGMTTGEFMLVLEAWLA